jgi:hypothetical protein
LKIKKKVVAFKIKQYSGMWRRVDIALTDVSEERIASIFRVEEDKKPGCEPV